MDRRAGLLLGLLLGLALVATLAPAPPARACSCAVATAEEMVERDPDVAIAVVRRVDRDGGADGIGRVERTLRGDLPDELPLDLDDGASCKPWLGAGHLGTLAFERDGSSWRTFDCSRLDTATTFAQAYGPMDADPPGTGEPAVLLLGPLPGAGLVLLDTDLEPIATALEPPGPAFVEPCGDAVVAVEVGGEEQVATLLSLPDLGVLDERDLGAPAWQERIVDVTCREDGRVSAVTALGEGPLEPLSLYDDLLEGGARELPAATDAAFAGDVVVLLRSDHDARRSELEAYDLATGEVAHLAAYEDMAAYELTVAPDGRHVTVRGFADEPVLLVADRTTGETVGHSTGWWMPTPQPWLEDDRLLLFDESSGREAPPGLTHRVVDTRLDVVAGAAAVPEMDNWLAIAARGHVIGVGGAELTVAGPDGSTRKSTDARTAAASDARLLGPVSPQAGVRASPGASRDASPGTGTPAPTARPEPDGSPADANPAQGTVRAVLVPGLLLGAALLLVGRTRGRWLRAATSWRARSRGSRPRRGR